MPATNQSAVSTLIREVLADPDLAHDDVFRRLLQAGLQDLVDAEAAAVIGAQRYERTPQRTNRRNGTRPKTGATTPGEGEVATPHLEATHIYNGIFAVELTIGNLVRILNPNGILNYIQGFDHI